MPFVRPPLPPGPYLVVGLARSGVAAARLLAARGERVIGVDAAEVPAARELDAIEVHAPSDGVRWVGEVRTVVKSPGVPQASKLSWIRMEGSCSKEHTPLSRARASRRTHR